MLATCPQQVVSVVLMEFGERHYTNVVRCDKLIGEVARHARHARHPRRILTRMSRVSGVSTIEDVANMLRENCWRGI